MCINVKYLLFYFLIFGLLIQGCKKNEEEIDNGGNNKELASATTLKINTFVKDVMTDLYLWYDKMPTIDIKYETDSKAYFGKLLYTDDKWSYITDDATSFLNSLQGIEKSFGYSLAFGRFTNASGAFTGNYFAIVEYVYPNTPASRAGFTRGNIIVKLNGGDINSTNYTQLLSGTASVSVTKGTLTGSGITEAGTVSMTAEELSLDPVLMYKIVEREGHKIGYLLYLQFISSYNNTSLRTALQYFKDNQITDLVLDLRYNPGGYTTAAQYLCSSVAPLSVLNANSTLVTYKWNDKYQAYWVSKQRDDQLRVNFDSSVPVKLGLSKLFILTGQGTASASEFTITGLSAYMGVILVGDTTYGKYTASFTIQPSDWYTNASDYSSFTNWAVQPIVMRYANANGVTDFKNGFAPTFLVRDELLPAFPLGDITEPLLKKAVEQITGVQITAIKAAKVPFNYEIIDHGFSRFDEQRRNLYFDKVPQIK